MRRRTPFARSLVAAALLAALFPAFALVAGPVLGGSRALALYLAAAAAAYVAAIAPRRAEAAAAASLAAGLGAAVLALAAGPRDAALGAALVVSVCRSAVLYRARRARSLVLEGLLVTGGLALARHLAGPGLLDVALALWGFGLVQSAFFLVGGVGERRGGAEDVDPFELARARALRLLEEDPR